MDLYLCFICFLVSSFVLFAFFLLTSAGKRGGMNMMMTLPSLRQMRGSLVRLKSWKLSEDQRNEKVPQSNFEAEMKRRNKINDIFHILRTLLPNNTGMDRASVIGDTIAYVSKLQRQVKELQKELQKELERPSNVGAKETSYSCGNDGNLQSESPCQIETIIANTPVNEKMEPRVEVIQLDVNQFSVTVLCEHKTAGFVRLMEALDTLGLEVTYANVTSFKTLISNVFKVQKHDSTSKILQADHVRDSLLEITRKLSTDSIIRVA